MSKTEGQGATTVSIVWSSIYQPAWDETPGAYVEAGLVGWGRSRRLARAEDASVALKAYLGVQHYDPGRWYQAGEARTRFFLSLFVGGRTLSLRTYPTVEEALAALEQAHRRLRGGERL